MRRYFLNSVAVLVVVFCGTGSSWAESLSPQDREDISRLRSIRGLSPEGVEQLIEQVNRAGERGIPTEPLANKVKEGLAKGVEPRRIDPVLRQMVSHFEQAQDVLREAGSRGITEGNRQRALETMADAMARGATPDDVRELSRLTQEGKYKVSQETLASGAKGLAVMKEGKIPSQDGAALVSEGMRQGYRASELVDLGREVKRRGDEFRKGTIKFQELRDKMSRGERGEKLFRDSDHGGSGRDGERGSHGGGGGDRDRGDRGDRGGDRGDRGDRGDHGSGGGGDRGDRGDRSGHGGRDR
ncbi:MAG TPA: hypothetical protein VIR79_06205 [Nitrospira sp.]